MASRSSSWRVAIALLALGAVPVVAGSLRLVELAGGPARMPSDIEYGSFPGPLAVHIVSAIVFAVLGPLQFSAGLRRRRPGWHRRVGRLLVVAGLGVALSAIWLNQFFPRAGAAREVLYPMRMAFAAAMVLTILLGFAAARRRDFTRHRAWMIRGYAIGMVAGTQVFTIGFGQVIFGKGGLATALLMVAAWGINLTVAERAIRRQRRRPVSAAAVSVTVS